ncbi:MAG: DeoR/GlpR family DNA-binding transcription regulator [Halanaerobiaceae bacterium]
MIFTLSENKDINIISTGGTLRPNSLSFVGPLTCNTIGKYFADKLFASCKGISPLHGATDSNELEIEVKKKMVQQSGKKYILADSENFDRMGLSQFIDIEQIDKIITNMNKEEIRTSSGRGIQKLQDKLV